MACLTILGSISSALAADASYAVEISVLPETQLENSQKIRLDDLLQKHLEIIKWRDNPRMSPSEWLRLYHATPSAIADLLATEGYFSPEIKPSIDNVGGVSKVRFLVNPGNPVLVSTVDLKFSGSILQQPATDSSKESSNIAKLKQNWLLQPGSQFRQEDWNQAKRQLLISLLIEHYPNATIKASKAEVNPESGSVALALEIDSGQSFRFGVLEIEGLQRYPASIIENLNPIKPGSAYSQTRLQTFQSRLEESGYFRGVEVTANTASVDTDVAPVKVVVQENQSVKMGVGAGYSTNTGARTQLTY
ncbi:MAG: POTRA domain-containing protein, partial [Methylotenera sp.]